MGHAQLQAPPCDLHLGRNGIQAIDHIIKATHVDFIGVFGQIEHLMDRHLAVGIDVTHALSSHIHLSAAYGAVQGKNLAIDVRHTHLVVINQVKRPHPTAGQRLDHIAAHAANAKHRHTAPGQSFHRPGTQHQLSARKRTLYILMILHTDNPDI